MSDSLKSYLSYLKNVLGIKNVLMTTPDMDSQISTNQAEKPVFYFVRPKPMNDSELKMFQNIKKAFTDEVGKARLLADVTEVDQTSVLEQGAFKARDLYIFFLDPSTTQSVQSRLLQASALYLKSLQEMDESPQLKKQVWADLKNRIRP